MNRTSSCVLLVGMLTGCATSQPGSPTSISVPVTVPGYSIEVTIPPGWQRGYGSLRQEISFDDPRMLESGYAMGEGAIVIPVGTFFRGVTGNFRDWDMDLEIDLIHFKQPIRSTKELAAYLSPIFSAPKILKDGAKFYIFKEPKIEVSGTAEVVFIESRDLRIHKHLELEDRVSMFIAPMQIFYVRIDDKMAASVRIEHVRKKSRNDEWFEQSHQTGIGVISRMRFQSLQTPNRVAGSD